MGKVRKLRKKYEILCRKNAAISKTSDSKKKLKIPVLPVKENLSRFDVRSSSSTSIPTKDKSTHRISEHLSSGKDAIGPLQCKRFSSNTTEILKLGDNLPVIKKHVGPKKNMSRRIKMKGITDHPKYPRKQNAKIRQNNFMQDIYVFKKTLNEESFLKNPQAAVMNQTLERLSAECSFYSKK